MKCEFQQKMLEFHTLLHVLLNDPYTVIITLWNVLYLVTNFDLERTYLFWCYTFMLLSYWQFYFRPWEDIVLHDHVAEINDKLVCWALLVWNLEMDW